MKRRFSFSLWTVSLLLLYLSAGFAQQRSYPASGVVLKVDAADRTIFVSCAAIPGFMDAMAMPLAVTDAKQLESLHAGAMIDFTLVPDVNASRAESIRIHAYQGMEPDPLAANRLKLLNRAMRAPSIKPVAIGQSVPDFTLIEQNGHPVTLSRFRGKVVALDFVYTRCALPNFCARSSGNFSSLQRRFHSRLTKDLVLLTVTFDPVHDSPEILEKYAQIWHAKPSAWHFLTGPDADVKRVCDFFGEDYFPDEGLMDHSLHTAVIDRNGRLVANLEGNEFSAKQLGDFVQTVLGETQ